MAGTVETGEKEKCVPAASLKRQNWLGTGASVEELPVISMNSTEYSNTNVSRMEKLVLDRCLFVVVPFPPRSRYFIY